MTEPTGDTVGGADSGVCELTSKSRYLGKGRLKRQDGQNTQSDEPENEHNISFKLWRE